MLPGECFHDASQNPRAASSIGQTQHVQITATSLLEWPLLQLQHSPVWADSLQAFLDICQVGDESDAFYVKLATQTPDSEAVISFLVELRLELLTEFKRTVDFTCKATPREDGWFVVTFAPVAAIEFDKAYVAYNRATGHDHRDYNIPYRCVDAASCMGSLMTWGAERFALAQEGRPVMERIYDFTRRPGSRRIVARFLLKRFAYTDEVGKTIGRGGGGGGARPSDSGGGGGGGGGGSRSVGGGGGGGGGGHFVAGWRTTHQPHEASFDVLFTAVGRTTFAFDVDGDNGNGRRPSFHTKWTPREGRQGRSAERVRVHAP